MQQKRVSHLQLTVFEKVLHCSRAVRVNGDNKIPLPFVYALAESEVHGENFSPAALSAALILGFLKPRESLISNLHRYDYLDRIYVIVNHLPPDQYGYLLEKKHLKFTQDPYKSAEDVLLEVIPKL